MSYSVSAVQPADIPRLADIQWAALSSNPLTKVLYPRGPTSALLEYTNNSYRRTSAFPSAKLIKATKDATGEIVGFAKWILYRKDEEQHLRQSVSGIRQPSTQSRRSSGWEKEKHLMPPLPPDCHGILLEKWGDTINKTRKKVGGRRGHACKAGRPCTLECYLSSFADNMWVLDIFHVIPLYQQTGVGTALLNWGLQQADKEGIHSYVEASPAAWSLCLKKGFDQFGDIRIELGRYKDGFKDYAHSVMVRPPQGATNAPTIPPIRNPFEDEGEISPISPADDDDVETPYTAEAKMLEFRSSSSLRSARLMDARASTKSLSNQSNRSHDIPPPLPKGPSLAKAFAQ